MAWIPLLLLAALAAGIARMRARRRRPSAAYPRDVRRALFTPSQRSVLGALERMVGRGERVFGNVTLREVVDLDARLARTAAGDPEAQARARRLDFVVVCARDLRVTCVVELDDTHDARPLDEGVRRAFARAGVPLVRFPERGTRHKAAVHRTLRAGMRGVAA